MNSPAPFQNGEACLVTGGTHKGKKGIVQDVHLSKTGHWTLTVLQQDGIRFKTLAKNITTELI